MNLPDITTGMTRARYLRSRYIDRTGAVVGMLSGVVAARHRMSVWLQAIEAGLGSVLSVNTLLRGSEGVKRIQLDPTLRVAGNANSTSLAKTQTDGITRMVSVASISHTVISTFQLAACDAELAALVQEPALPVARILERINAIDIQDISRNPRNLIVLIHTPNGDCQVTHHHAAGTTTEGDVPHVDSVPLVQVAIDGSDCYELVDEDGILLPANPGAPKAVLAYAMDNMVVVGMDVGAYLFRTAEPIAAVLERKLRYVASDIKTAMKIYAAFWAESLLENPAGPRLGSDAEVMDGLIVPLRGALTTAQTTLRAEYAARLRTAQNDMKLLSHTDLLLHEIEGDLLPGVETYVAHYIDALRKCDHPRIVGIGRAGEHIAIHLGDIQVPISNAAGTETVQLAIPISVKLRIDANVSTGENSSASISCMPTGIVTLGDADVQINNTERSLALLRRWWTDPTSALRTYVDEALVSAERYLTEHKSVLMS